MAGLSTAASTKRASACRGKYGQFVKGMRYFTWLPLLLLGLLPGLAAANADRQIAEILELSDAPDGVVFEIVESDEYALEELLPRVRAAIERIRERHPQTDFAVVSHGREEFALQSQYQQELAPLHQQVQSLVAEDVPVHVCETHAGWYGVTAEDFPSYVDVAPTGPGQVNLYRELGYQLIIFDLDE